MSTDYTCLPKIPFDELFDGRLAKYGISERLWDGATENLRCLEGRDGVVTAYRDDDGYFGFEQRGAIPWSVMGAIANPDSFDSKRENYS